MSPSGLQIVVSVAQIFIRGLGHSLNFCRVEYRGGYVPSYEMLSIASVTGTIERKFSTSRKASVFEFEIVFNVIL